MTSILVFLKKELLEILPPTIFFLVVFQIALLTRRVMGLEGPFYVTSSATAIVGALIVGKSVLIADASPLLHFFREKRLIYNVVWRTLLYLAVVLVFQGIEELIPLVSKHGGVGAALGRLIDEIDWTGFWATHAVFAVFLGFYTFVTALIELIGVDRFVEVFFGFRRTGAGRVQS